MTGKTDWRGKVDADGVPVNTLSNGRKFQFLILITQKDLGHWNQWLINKGDKDRLQFLTLCNWLVEHQDDSGGWDTWRAFQDAAVFELFCHDVGPGTISVVTGI